MSNQDVYDKEDVAENTGQHDDLGVHPERREAEVDSLNKQYDNSDLSSAEKSGAGGSTPSKGDKKELDQIGSGFRNEDDGSNKIAKKAKSIMSGRRGKLIMGGGLGGGIAGLIIASFFLLPLKVMHIATNLQNHYFASAEEATDNMTDRLLGKYIVNKVMPGMIEGKCTTTKVSKSCAHVTKGDGPVALLYNTWRDARFESKLANKYGIEIQRDGKNQFKLITPSIKEGINLGNYDPGRTQDIDGKLFAAMDRGQVRREMRDAFQGETFAKRILYRYKVGRFVERKYGVKRCLIGCNARDRHNDNKEARRLAWKGYFIDRIVIPRNEMMGIAMRCALGGFKCTETPKDADERGEQVSEFERDTRAMLAERRSRAGDTDLDELHKQTESYKNDGFTSAFLKTLVGPGVATITGKAIPWIGWIDLAFALGDGAREAGPAARKINYIMNSQAMLTTYMLYRSHADEVKSGEVNAEVVGSITNSLGPDAGTDQNGKGAEGTPLYGELMGSTPKTASIFNNVFPIANAEGGYPCNQDTTISSGVCPELILSTTRGATQIAGGISEVFNSPLFINSKVSAAIWNYSIGWLYDHIIDFAGDALGDVATFIIKNSPYGKEFLELTDEIMRVLSSWFVNWFVNNPIGDSPSGGRNFDMAAGGADVAGNDFAHYGLGAKEIKPEVADAIRAKRKQEKLDSFMQQPFFARMVDASSDKSLLSKAALALPSSTASGITRSFSSLITNPLGSLTSGFNRYAPSQKAEADSDAKDPFGVTQYGYTSDDPVFNTDPEKYWEDNDCGDPEEIKKWGELSEDNSETGMPEHKVAFGCQLLGTATTMAGGIYNDDLFTAEDLNGTEGSSLGQSGTAGNLRAASFNIYHSADQPKEEYEARLRKSVDVLINNAVDVAGLQEVRPNQIVSFLKPEFGGSTYEMWPKALKQPSYSPNPIVWNKAKYKLIKTYEIPFLYFGGSHDKAPMVKLEDIQTKQQFYFANTHDPADARGEAAVYRWENAKYYAEYFKKLESDNLPIIFAGDFNSGYRIREGSNNTYLNDRDNLTYCILTKGTVFWDSYDASKKKKGTCPSDGVNFNDGFEGSANANPVDHIFVSRENAVTKFFRVPCCRESNGSDVHDTIIADVTIGGVTDGGGGVVLGKDYVGAEGLASGSCVDYVKHIMSRHFPGYGGQSMGDGFEWAGNFGRKYGLAVNHTPAVHAVVSFPKSMANPTYGHVAIVAEVKKDGSIVVEEFNWTNPNHYGTHVVSADKVSKLTYAHAETKWR